MAEAEPEGPVLVALEAADHLPAPHRALVREGCELAAITTCSWRQGAPLAAGADWPALAIAALPSGVRRLPSDLHALLSERFPRLPLLLLCEEPLVRPTVVSHGGRVVLVGPPLTAEQVAARIQMLVANRAANPALRARPGAARGDVRVQLSARHWVGWLGAPSGSPSAPFSAGSDGSLTALLPFAAESVTPELLKSAREALTGQAGSEPAERGVAKLLGERFAALHLPPSGEQWTVYRGTQRASLRLWSPQRLPSLWDHPHTKAPTPLFTKRAASGDIMILSSASELPPCTNPELEVCVGGPGLLRRFAAAAPHLGAGASTVIVEVL